MSEPIFISEPEDSERPVDYIANPVRVQLPHTTAAVQGRKYTRLDLVALANNIVARENACRQLETAVRQLTLDVLRIFDRVEQLESDARLVRALRTALVEAGLPHEGDADYDED